MQWPEHGEAGALTVSGEDSAAGEWRVVHRNKEHREPLTDSEAGHGRAPREQASRKNEHSNHDLQSQSSARPTFRASPVSRASAESCQQLRPWDLDPPLGRSVALFARRPRPCSRASGSGGTPPFGFALLARAFGGLRTCWTGSSADADDDDDDSAVCTDAYRL